MRQASSPVMAADIDEQDDVAACISCGRAISTTSDRAFASGPDAFLCFECAESRGGVFNENEDRWTRAPDVSGLPDERRPHP